MFQFKASQAGEILFTQRRTSLFVPSMLQLIGRGPPTLGRAIYCTQSTHLNVNLIQNTLRDTSRIRFGQISGHLMTQLSWHKKLTITGLIKDLHSLMACSAFLKSWCHKGSWYFVWSGSQKRYLLKNSLAVFPICVQNFPFLAVLYFLLSMRVLQIYNKIFF